jgi:subtilase family protein
VLTRLSAVQAAHAAGWRPSSRSRRIRAVAQLAGVVLAAAGLCAVTVIPAQADAVRDQEMWVLDMVHAPSVWPVTQGQGVLVAVIDSGVSPSVSDLAGSVTEGPNLSGVNTPPSNASWGVHGTWMASLIAGHGHGDGSSGIEGVAPQSRVLSIRVVTDRGDPNFGNYEQESNGEVQQALAKAITVAAKRGADVISMSLGYGTASRPVRVALQNALDRGVVVVASSGNSGDTASALSTGQAPYSFPADYPGVLGVGAVTQAESAASFSSNNLSVEIAAPGVKVPAQGRDGQYWLVSGTSPACALTAGVAALIKSRYPHLSPALVDQAITSTAQNPPPKGYDGRVGFGTVDAAAALTAAGTLSRDVTTGRGVKVATHFGGGAAAVPPVPVAPRGPARLILYAVLVLACLAIAAVAAVRLTRRSPAAVPAVEPWQDDAPLQHSAPWPGNGAWESNGAWPGGSAPPGNEAWAGNGAWPGSGTSPPGSGAWAGSDDPPGNEAWGGNGTWESDRARTGNGAWESDVARPRNGAWEGDGSRQGHAAWEDGSRPGNGAWEGDGSRQGHAAWEGDGSRLGHAAWEGDGSRQGHAAWEGNGAWEGDRGWGRNGAWPGSEPWPTQPGRRQAPSGEEPAPQPPSVSLAPPVPPDSPFPPVPPEVPSASYPPDLSRWDLPPAQTPPADPGAPGEPWPPPGP